MCASALSLLWSAVYISRKHMVQMTITCFKSFEVTIVSACGILLTCPSFSGQQVGRDGEDQVLSIIWRELLVRFFLFWKKGKTISHLFFVAFDPHFVRGSRRLEIAFVNGGYSVWSYCLQPLCCRLFLLPFATFHVKTWLGKTYANYSSWLLGPYVLFSVCLCRIIRHFLQCMC